MLRATLVDNAGPPGALPSFDIRYAPDASEPVWIEFRFTVAFSPEFYTLDFAETDPELLGYGPNVQGDRIDDMANIYFRTRQFVDWVKTRLTADTGATVEFYTFANAACPDATGESAGACRMLVRVRELWASADSSLDAARSQADSLYRKGCR